MWGASMMTERGQWGGRREGAGRKATWKSGTCKAVKLPVALVDQVLLYARQLDEGVLPSPPPATAAPERDWDLLERTIAEKATLEVRHQQLEKQLEKVVVSQQQQTRDLETRSERWRVQNLDAQRTLSEALREHRKTKRGIPIGSVEYALHALGGYQDFPNRKPPVANSDTAEELQRLAQLEAQNQEQTLRLHEQALRIDALSAERERLQRDLTAAREALDASKPEPAGCEQYASENDAIYKAVILLRAGLERKGGVRPSDVAAAIAALTGSPDGAAAAELPPAGKGQLGHIVDEKLAANRKARNLESALAGERKQLRALTLAEQRAQARIADARSILLNAYRERQGGVRKPITPAAVKSALLALGQDVDREAEREAAPST